MLLPGIGAESTRLLPWKQRRDILVFDGSHIEGLQLCVYDVISYANSVGRARAHPDYNERIYLIQNATIGDQFRIAVGVWMNRADRN